MNPPGAGPTEPSATSRLLVLAPKLNIVGRRHSFQVNGRISVEGMLCHVFKRFVRPSDPEVVVRGFSRTPEELSQTAKAIAEWTGAGILVKAPVGANKGGASDPLVTRIRSGCSQLFLLFSGQGEALSRYTLTEAPPAPDEELSGFMTSAGLHRRNIAILRDLLGRYYTAGVSFDLPTIETLTAWLRDFRARLTHVEEQYTMGTSMGAFAAIAYGYALGVKEVFAFAPTALRYDGVDLTRIIAASTSGTRCRVFFCEGNARDREVAEGLSVVPGVELCPQPGDTHLVFRVMMDRGALASVLPPFKPPLAHSSASGLSECR